MIRLTLFFMLVSLQGWCRSPNEINRQMKAIAMVESNDNHQKYNPRTDAVGWLQIRKIMVLEANRIIGYNKFSYRDRYHKRKQQEIFRIIIKHHNPRLSLKVTCRVWNGGQPNKPIPKWYIRRVVKMYRSKG